MRYLPAGRRLAMSGVLRASSSKRARSSAHPARRAIATRCTSALVEPPIASTAVTALSNEASERIEDGRRSSHTISTIRLPVCVAICAWRESAAGMEAAPGSVRPSASAALVMVEAWPIVMQWPGERPQTECTLSHTDRPRFTDPHLLPHLYL